MKFTVYVSPFYPVSGDVTFPHMTFRYETIQDRCNPLEKAMKYAEAIAINPVPDFPNVDIAMENTPALGHLDQFKKWRIPGVSQFTACDCAC